MLPPPKGLLRDLPIRRKLLALMAVPFAVAIVLAGVSLETRAVSDRGYREALAWDQRVLATEHLENRAIELVMEVASNRSDTDRIETARQWLIQAWRTALSDETGLSRAERLADDQLLSELIQLAELGAAPNAASEQELWTHFRVNIEPRLHLRLAGEQVHAGLSAEQGRRRSGHILAVGVAVGLAVLALGIAVSIAFARYFRRELGELEAGANRISDGDLDTRIPYHSHDELGRVAVAFNTMAIALQQTMCSKDELEHEVEKRTTALKRSSRELSRSLRQLRRAQSQLSVSERLVALGTLAAGIGHEINNPLAFVLGNLEYLREELQAQQSAGADLADVLSVLEEVFVGAQRVRDIVKDLKAFSRSDGTTAGPVSVEKVIDSTLGMIANQVHHKASLVKDYGGVPDIAGNEGKLGQVFLNLILNAAQAMSETQAEHNEIRLVTRADADGVRIEVRDNGPGIPPEVVGRVFDPFFTTKRVGEGTGLGLSIARRIVEDAGGHLSVVSAVGQGCVFTVTLPLGLPAALVAPADALPRTPARARILVIDDEPMVGAAIKRSLRGHQVACVTSGADALAKLAAGEQFDVILCDMMMPGMTGPMVHAELLRTSPSLAARMVFITGGAFTPAARAFLDSVPNRTLEKPFAAAALTEVVALSCSAPAAAQAVRPASPPSRDSRWGSPLRLVR